MNSTSPSPSLLADGTISPTTLDVLTAAIASVSDAQSRTRHPPCHDDRPQGIAYATVIHAPPDGPPVVGWIHGGEQRRAAARSLAATESLTAGSEVAVAFPADSSQPPLILGLLRVPENSVAAGPAQVEINDQRLELTAEAEMVLRCGKASITLTRAGKVLIKGEYLSSHSSGVHRIRGGSVQIN